MEEAWYYHVFPIVATCNLEYKTKSQIPKPQTYVTPHYSQPLRVPADCQILTDIFRILKPSHMTAIINNKHMSEITLEFCLALLAL